MDISSPRSPRKDGDCENEETEQLKFNNSNKLLVIYANVDSLQFFSRYPAMGVHPLLLEWHSSAMRNNVWWFLKGLLEGINGWFRSG